MNAHHLLLYSLALVFLAIYLVAELSITSGIPRGGDFINMWYGSYIARHEPDFFELLASPTRYFAYLRAHISPDFTWHNWSYSPLMLLLVWPLSMIGYYPALAVWVALGMGFYYAEARHYVTRRQDAWLLLICPAMTSALGQNGFFTAALLLGAWRRRESSPLVAGLMIALLTVKPHLYLLLPIALLGVRAWKTIAATIVWIAILFALTVWAFGLDAWCLYFTAISDYQVTVLEHGQGLLRWMMPSVFNAVLVAGHSLPLAYTLHILLAMPVVLHYLITQWRRATYRTRIEFTLFASFLLTPYIFVYDLMVLMPFLLNRLLPPSDSPAERSTLAHVLWFFPGFWLLTPLLPTMLGTFLLCSWVACFYAYYFCGLKNADAQRAG